MMMSFTRNIMYICNITFATEEKNLDKLLQWIRENAIDPLSRHGLAANPRLTRIVPSVCGCDQSELISICLQFEFRSIQAFGSWQENAFAPVMRQYSEIFAPEPLFFTSLLEEIPLKVQTP